MKEADLRRWHRKLGVVLALFLFVQALTGFLLSVTWLAEPHSEAPAATAAPQEESFFEELLEELHVGGETVGAIYRVLLGATTVLQVVLGYFIYTSMKKRMKKA